MVAEKFAESGNNRVFPDDFALRAGNDVAYDFGRAAENFGRVDDTAVNVTDRSVVGIFKFCRDIQRQKVVGVHGSEDDNFSDCIFAGVAEFFAEQIFTRRVFRGVSNGDGKYDCDVGDAVQ